MKKYTIEKTKNTKRTWYMIYDRENKKYFAGYDFMCSVNWVENPNGNNAKDCFLTEEEAEQIVKDLESMETSAINRQEIIFGGPELSFEISEANAPLETIIEIVEREYPGWTFDRTEARYESCIMAIFTKD